MRYTNSIFKRSVKKKYIYHFGIGQADGDASMTSLLGGKGANLAEMSNINLPIPPGFTITSEVCNLYYKSGENVLEEVKKYVVDAINVISLNKGLEFANKDKPLLVSVRSGAKFSMPGMLDTILNIGINDEIAASLAKNNSRFAYDSYRRLIQMYGVVVLKMDAYQFEEALETYKMHAHVSEDQHLDGAHLSEVCMLFKKIVFERIGSEFPQDVYIQLFSAVSAVFDSWNNERALIYRKIHNLPSNIGTAVTVQAMVFGNMNNNSGSGVAFTRNPSTGEKALFGEYIVNAQGEDVVSGIRTPKSIEEMSIEMPNIYQQLCSISSKLERHYKDMQDIEFTIQDDVLWILQTRSGKRSGIAEVRIAVDMVSESLISVEQAILNVNPSTIEKLLHSTVIISKDAKIIGEGLAASPGAASGVIAFSSEAAVNLTKKFGNVILIRNETSPEDILGMNISQGIVTTKGGVTSHAAVVARGMGKPCICGVHNLYIDLEKKCFSDKNGCIFHEGDVITMDGARGLIFAGSIATAFGKFSEHVNIFFGWVDKIRLIKVRANADSPKDAKNAINLGADGIGLCRTEHMFFERDRIFLVRKMILSDTQEERKDALSSLLPIQKEDFKAIFHVMKNLSVTIRLLDPPLHEFLPNNEKSIDDFVNQSGWNRENVVRKIESLKEVNPMLGHRGSRLAFSFPEIYQMQLHAIFSAAEESPYVHLEIMLPFIMNESEFLFLKQLVHNIAKDYKVKYLLGNMIELPCAVICSDKLARHSDFFSFGTNDLTQTTLGMSRDDSVKFLNIYQEHKIFSADPFSSIDDETVGEMIRLSAKLGRSVKPQLKLGLCGEHGGDPKSISLFAKMGIDYISCSPYRLPIARLVLAQIAIQQQIA